MDLICNRFSATNGKSENLLSAKKIWIEVRSMQNRMTLVVQLAVGLVFLLSAAGKIMTPRDFARGVVEYQVLPDRLSYLVGLLLIPTEILLAAVHLTGMLLPF